MKYQGKVVPIVVWCVMAAAVAQIRTTRYNSGARPEGCRFHSS